MLILPVLLECLLSLSLCGELINEAVLLRRKRYRDEPIAVMVGVIVDAQRMHVTKSDWRDLLISLSHVVGRSVEEIHTRDFYAGNGHWRALDGDQRAGVITEIFGWLKARRHGIVYSSVEKSKFYQTQKAGRLPNGVNSLWRFLGLHLLLTVQKAHQALAKTKGHTIFVFDNEERERMRFTDLVANPPAWTDSYYGKKKKQGSLNQIVDVPYFGDSSEVHLLQVADFVAYFLRRHAEITGGYSPERYELEASRIEGWLRVLRSCSLAPRFIYPATGRCDCADIFYNHAPDTLRNLHRT